MPLEDLVLIPETDARRILAGRALRMRVLAPLGTFAGRGVLRVLRTIPAQECVELVCGYESYEQV